MNVRVIAATSRNLEEGMTNNTFREDLYYRLNVFPILLPALRLRKSDILLLADHFLQKYSEMYAKNMKRISTSAINMMMAYHWPGNVRELENCLERAVILCMGQFISEKELLPAVIENYNSGLDFQQPGSTIGNRSLDDVEIITIKETLVETKGNKSQAAKILNL